MSESKSKSTESKSKPARRAKWRFRVETGLLERWRWWPMVEPVAVDGDATRWSFYIVFLHVHALRTMVDVPSLKEVKPREG